MKPRISEKGKKFLQFVKNKPKIRRFVIENTERFQTTLIYNNNGRNTGTNRK